MNNVILGIHTRAVKVSMWMPDIYYSNTKAQLLLFILQLDLQLNDSVYLFSSSCININNAAKL